MFENMRTFLEKAWNSSGFKELTPVQMKTSELIAEGEDLIVESPTGSGKTLAYLIPLLQKLDLDQVHTQIIVLASSHELVMQINTTLQDWIKDSGISSTTLIGGANIKRQVEKLKKKPKIVVGTPGRVHELIKMKKLKVHEVKTVVLDEADQLLVPEHRSTIDSIIKGTPQVRQILLFSATLPESVENEAMTFMQQPKVIRISKKEINHPPVDHLYFVCEAREKIEVLRKLIRIIDGKALVFFSDINNLSVIAEKLEYKGIIASTLHSSSKKQEREQAIKKFRTGQSDVLLATDVAARGLDIQDLTHVIHMDISPDTAQYIHRSGRTGRLGSEGGTVISIVSGGEIKNLKKISRDQGFILEEKSLYKGQIKNNR
ncbi:DEAD/DEAH box helicase [Aquibacillus koreensis]|uniref:DEAD/DEAH box helicase n=1 Tax=Aquibacillus koreensis TaxID=279446 RepID=A0A9X3WL52_9BACI|nr:DEAD/DEAH box helicase [Aquibacillus koreensis]MCT2534250.1 DEAD/DEAH box helicase [Aquibacillus koreensis]MDC3420705.1 DEAD/DEAH box helicase [Aquibacillus koreensis]